MRIPVLDQPCHAFMGNTAPNLMDLDPIFVRDCALIVTRVHALDSLDQTNQALILTLGVHVNVSFKSLCHNTSTQTHCFGLNTMVVFVKCTTAGFDDRYSARAAVLVN